MIEFKFNKLIKGVNFNGKKLNLYSLAEGLGLKEIGYMLYGGKINDIEIQLSTKYKDITFFVGDQDNALRFNLDDEF